MTGPSGRRLPGTSAYVWNASSRWGRLLVLDISGVWEAADLSGQAVRILHPRSYTLKAARATCLVPLWCLYKVLRCTPAAPCRLHHMHLALNKGVLPVLICAAGV